MGDHTTGTGDPAAADTCQHLPTRTNICTFLQAPPLRRWRLLFSGCFLLANLRSASTPGYVGRLHGPYLTGNHRYCVRFYYLLQAFRKVDNALILYVYDEHNVAVEKVWSLSSNSKSVWTQVEITFMKPMLTKVRRTYVARGVLNGRMADRAPLSSHRSWCSPASVETSGNAAWSPSTTSPFTSATVRSQQVSLAASTAPLVETGYCRKHLGPC